MDRNSFREIVHLTASLIVLTIAFSYPGTDIETLAIAAVGVGSGFILHELAHKFTAQRYGYAADYEASPAGLMLAIGLSIFTNGGFVFAAPGAVMIRGKKFYNPYYQYADMRNTAREFAYISVSGAFVNLILAIFFYLSSNFVNAYSIEYHVLHTAAFINVFLGGFNMLPFGPLDGAKVWKYSPLLWGTMILASLILFYTITRSF